MNTTSIRQYAAAIGFARIGTSVFFLINTWLIMEISGKPSSAAISLIMTILPSLLLSPLLGVLVDRRQPIRLAYTAEVIRFLVLACYATLYAAGKASTSIGYVVSFMIALGGEIQLLAWRATLTSAASSGQMHKLNTLTSIWAQSGQVLGVVASGLILAKFGAVPTIVISASAFLISAWLGMLLSHRLGNTVSMVFPLSTVTGRIHNHFSALKSGLSHIIERPEVTFFYGLILANVTVLYTINSMLAPFVRDELHLGPDAFGKIDAAFAIGMIVSGLMAVRLTDQFGRYRIMVAGFITMALSITVLAFSHNFLVALLAYGGIGISFQTSILSLTLAQEATELEFQGRVNSTFNILNGIAGLIIYGLSVVVSQRRLYREFYFAEAILILAVVPIILMYGRRPHVARLLNPTSAVMDCEGKVSL